MTDTKRPTVTIDYDAKPIEFEAVWRDHGGKTRDALAAGAEVDVLDALWTEHEAAMEALRRLRPRTVDGLERSDDDE